MEQPVRPRFVLGGDRVETPKKRPRLVLSEPVVHVADAAAGRSAPGALWQPPVLAPPGRVPLPTKGSSSGGYHDRVVHVFSQQPTVTGTKRHSVGRWRRGRIKNFRGCGEAGAASNQVRVVYIREATESGGVCDAAPAALSLESAEDEWMDIEANHDIRFELTDSNESLLEPRAAPRFGGWPDAMAATSARTDATPKPPQPAALPVDTVVRRAESANAVAVPAAGEQSFTAQDTTDKAAGQTYDYRQDGDNDDPVIDSDLDLDFLVDELSAFEPEMPPAQPSRAKPARAAGATAFVDVVDLT